jgi:transcriptional regulator with XRE-family HTH domain
MDKFRQWLRDYLQLRDKAAELSRHTGINDKTISRWKKGELPDQWAKLARLAKYTGISLDEMLLKSPENETIAGNTGIPSHLLASLHARLAKYKLETLSEERRDQLYKMLEILVQILTSEDEETKVAITANLKSFRTSVRRRDVIVGNKLPDPASSIDQSDETDRASPSVPDKPQKTILGGTGGK